MSGLPETLVIQKILDGEVSMYEILIRRFNPFLYKVGRSYGFCHEDVQDLMQDAFVSAYLNLSSFQNKASFKTWVITIMLNKCYHKTQRLRHKLEVSLNHHESEKSTPMFVSDHTHTNRAVVNNELSRVIEGALQSIPLEYRMVFSLREVSGLNTAETAEVLNISEANVKVRLTRARKMLRTEIEKMYSAEDIFEFNLIYCDQIVQKVMTEIGWRNVV
ncbi:MAG TPA: sigma-70 family RNA polymerase sigma factor [Cyclobacteriaceae bacterium]|nr:sigma-70 family RNA polymerase sigma factor [Cyclobacteriaceae bacterium]